LIAVADLQMAARTGLDLGRFLNEHRDKRVLVCGDFGDEGRRRLDAICDALTAVGYEPLLLETVTDVLEFDLRQKLNVVAAACRFVVIDDSSPAGQIAEVVHADAGAWITLVLRKEGSRSSMMTVGVEATSTVLREIEYSDEDLPVVMAEGVAWAEERLDDLKERRGSDYPWLQQEPEEGGGMTLDAGPW
jgi:hypothetical protein